MKAKKQARPRLMVCKCGYLCDDIYVDGEYVGSSADSDIIERVLDATGAIYEILEIDQDWYRKTGANGKYPKSIYDYAIVSSKVVKPRGQ